VGDRRLLAWFLRLLGLVELSALAAVAMPRAWMQAAHAWLGAGEMPPGPVFDSVMRQVSFTYGAHGAALWVIASDVDRYRPLVVLTAVGYLVAAPVFLAIDLANGMPRLWTAANGGSCLVLGALLTLLLWADRCPSPSEATKAVIDPVTDARGR
jgi:hypothetical protein